MGGTPYPGVCCVGAPGWGPCPCCSPLCRSRDAPWMGCCTTSPVLVLASPTAYGLATLPPQVRQPRHSLLGRLDWPVWALAWRKHANRTHKMSHWRDRILRTTWLPLLLRRHLTWLTRLSRFPIRVAHSVLYCWRGYIVGEAKGRLPESAWRHARDVHRWSRDHAVL